MKKKSKKSRKNPITNRSQEIRSLYSDSNELANNLFGLISRTRDPETKNNLQRAYDCIEKVESILRKEIL